MTSREQRSPSPAFCGCWFSFFRKVHPVSRDQERHKEGVQNQQPPQLAESKVEEKQQCRDSKQESTGQTDTEEVHKTKQMRRLQKALQHLRNKICKYRESEKVMKREIKTMKEQMEKDKKENLKARDRTAELKGELEKMKERMEQRKLQREEEYKRNQTDVFEGLEIRYSAVPKPGSDAAARDALDGSSVKCGEDGRWEMCLPQPLQEVKTLLGFLGYGASVKGPDYIAKENTTDYWSNGKLCVQYVLMY
ncbi:hypothetical protein NFI96_010450 [Prochilodus magdalenae]|nr:hypothetical protein NFI96_010450 [Prochilodus magdalenae]